MTASDFASPHDQQVKRPEKFYVIVKLPDGPVVVGGICPSMTLTAASAVIAQHLDASIVSFSNSGSTNKPSNNKPLTKLPEGGASSMTESCSLCASGGAFSFLQSLHLGRSTQAFATTAECGGLAHDVKTKLSEFWAARNGTIFAEDRREKARVRGLPTARYLALRKMLGAGVLPVSREAVTASWPFDNGVDRFSAAAVPAVRHRETWPVPWIAEADVALFATEAEAHAAVLGL